MEFGTYLEDELERIKRELKARDKLVPTGIILLTDEQLTVAYLISLYDATKGRIR